MPQGRWALLLLMGATMLLPAVAAAHPRTSDAHVRPLPVRAAKPQWTGYQYAVRAAQLRRMRGAIQLVKAEIRLLEKLEREYEPFTRFETGAPLTVTVERVRIDLLAAKLELRELNAQLSGLQRFGPLAAGGYYR